MFNSRLILKILGFLWLLLGLAMLVPLVYSLFNADSGTQPLLTSAGILLSLGGIIYLAFRRAESELKSREAFLLVSLAWFSTTVLGALPYLLSGFFDSPVDAWFESASGFTTTGATILIDIEAVPNSLLLWRSLSQFLGGMGIIVLSLAILPVLGVGGMDLYRAEAPGPKSDKIGARVADTARALWIIYVCFALLECVILYVLGMSFFDAVNHSLTTMATGGFSTKNASVAAFNSPAIEWVISVFMFLAGVNFLLHYRLILRRDHSVLADSEFRFYAVLAIAAILGITASLWGEQYDSFAEALRSSAFQVTSIMSSTGYATADYLTWGFFPQALLVILMVTGGCAGSTGGGIKCIRAILLVKQGYGELYRMIHPNAVRHLKVGQAVVSQSVSSAVFGYFYLYCLAFAVAGLILCASGVDLETSFSAVISALSNIGPGLGDVGPVLNYSGLPDLAKITLSACMIVGRLEVMTVLVLFTREYWVK